MIETIRRKIVTETVDERDCRRLGIVHVELAAGVNVATGGTLLFLGSTDRLLQFAYATLPQYVTSYTLLREAELVTVAATTGAAVVGVVFLCVGLIAALATTGWFRRQTVWRWVPVCGLSAINPLAAPLAAIALAFLWLGRPKDGL